MLRGGGGGGLAYTYSNTSVKEMVGLSTGAYRRSNTVFQELRPFNLSRKGEKHLIKASFRPFSCNFQVQ